MKRDVSYVRAAGLRRQVLHKAAVQAPVTAHSWSVSFWFIQPNVFNRRRDSSVGIVAWPHAGQL